MKNSVFACEVRAGDVLLVRERLLRVYTVNTTPTGRISLRVSPILVPGITWPMVVKASTRLIVEATR